MKSNPRFSTLLLGAVLAALLFPPRALPADAPQAAVAIAGAVSKPQSWTADQIKAVFAKDCKTITYTAKGQSHTALAIPLLSLVNAATPQLDAKIKNHALRFVIVVEGTDGYQAAFSLSELTPDLGTCQAWIALDMDGKPLADRDSPASLIVPTDQKPERWVHGIKTLHVLDVTPAHKDG